MMFPRASLIVLAACLACPVSAAQADGALRADAMLVPSGETVGEGAFFWLRSDSPAAELDAALLLRASSMHADVYERRATEVGPTPAVDPLESVTLASPPEVTQRPVDREDVVATAMRATGDFILTVRPLHEAPLHLQSDTGTIQATSFAGGAFTFTEGVDEGDNGAGADGGFTFSRVELPGAQVRLRTDTNGLHATIAGDLIVELQHMKLQVGNGDDELVIDTTTKTEALDPRLPGVTESAARARTESFARLVLTDATLDVSIPAFDGVSEWLLAAPTVTSAGSVIVVGAFGDARIGTHEYSLHGERATLDDVPPLALHAIEKDRLRIQSQAGAPDGGLLGAPSATSLAAGSVGVMLAFAAAGMGLAWLWRRGDMPHVEQAIARGRYRRAAVVAARIARRQPHREEAVVARAVALAKRGRHEQVIREVEERLRVHDASDGVLHYLLGVAYWESGGRGRARKFMREAAHRTPELRAAVADYVSIQSSETQAYV